MAVSDSGEPFSFNILDKFVFDFEWLSYVVVDNGVCLQVNSHLLRGAIIFHHLRFSKVF